MSEETKKSENIIPKKNSKNYLVTNKYPQPFEFHIGNNYFRLEPRGKDGDSVILSTKQVNHRDMLACISRVTVKESK